MISFNMYEYIESYSYCALCVFPHFLEYLLLVVHEEYITQIKRHVSLSLTSLVSRSFIALFADLIHL